MADKLLRDFFNTPLRAEATYEEFEQLFAPKYRGSPEVQDIYSALQHKRQRLRRRVEQNLGVWRQARHIDRVMHSHHVPHGRSVTQAIHLLEQEDLQLQREFDLVPALTAQSDEALSELETVMAGVSPAQLEAILPTADDVAQLETLRRLLATEVEWQSHKQFVSDDGALVEEVDDVVAS